MRRGILRGRFCEGPDVDEVPVRALRSPAPEVVRDSARRTGEVFRSELEVRPSLSSLAHGV